MRSGRAQFLKGFCEISLPRGRFIIYHSASGDAQPRFHRSCSCLASTSFISRARKHTEQRRQTPTTTPGLRNFTEIWAEAENTQETEMWPQTMVFLL